MSNKKKVLKDLERIFFPVRKASKKDFYRTDIEYLPDISHVILVTTSEGKEMEVNSCSEKYKLIPNKELMTPIIEAVTSEYEGITAKVKMHTYSKFYVDFVFASKEFGVGHKLKDTIAPRLRLNNSYDGSVKYEYQMGMQRFYCDNGAALPEGEQWGKKAMHTPASFQSVEDTMKDLSRFMKNAKEIISGYDPLFMDTLSMNAALERMEEVVEDTDYPKKTLESAVARLQEEAKEGFKINDWLVYNALNYALYNNPDSKMVTHKADKIDHEVMNYLITQ